MTSDLHIHPLDHKYYFAMTDGFSEVVLDEEDKNNIRSVVDWCCFERQLDCIALTDHDMIQASLYAMEYVKLAKLPIKIITGAECSVCDPNEQIGINEVHLLCLGIDALPKYSAETPVDKFISSAHALGGYVIMSHPVCYPDSFFRYAHLLDGYEFKNSNKIPFEDGKRFVLLKELKAKAYNGSDFHYRGKLPKSDSPILQCNHYDDKALMR